MNRLPLIVILGPTASGKTSLAVRLAQIMNTEIISGDSMLVYRGFDIGTAKPGQTERGGICHHLIDVLDPREQYNVVDFQHSAEQLINEINCRGRIPILAGGTALYIKALLEGYVFNKTSSCPAYRDRLEKLAEDQGAEKIYELLQRQAPETAAGIHPQNVRRVIRALEVLEIGEEKISANRTFQKTGELRFQAWIIGLRRSRENLYQRINARVLQMFESGLEDEVRKLLAEGIERNAPAMQGIGYKETAAWLAGECTRDDAISRIQAATRHFAKRQMTWYRQMPYIHWYDSESVSEEELVKKIISEVKNFFEETDPQGKGL